MISLSLYIYMYIYIYIYIYTINLERMPNMDTKSELALTSRTSAFLPFWVHRQACQPSSIKYGPKSEHVKETFSIIDVESFREGEHFHRFAFVPSLSFFLLYSFSTAKPCPIKRLDKFCSVTQKKKECVSLLSFYVHF